MTINMPSNDELRKIADDLGLKLRHDDIDMFLELMEANIGAFNDVDEMPDDLPAVKYPRGESYEPGPEEDPVNGFYVKTSIKGRPAASWQAKPSR